MLYPVAVLTARNKIISFGFNLFLSCEWFNTLENIRNIYEQCESGEEKIYTFVRERTLRDMSIRR